MWSHVVELCQPCPVLFHPDSIYFPSAVSLTIGLAGRRPGLALEATFPI